MILYGVLMCVYFHCNVTHTTLNLITSYANFLTLKNNPSTPHTNSALRELDRRNVIKSDPFILMQGDVITNVDLRDAMEGHKVRRKKDNAAIMTVLLQEVGGWGIEDDNDATQKNCSFGNVLIKWERGR